MEECLQVVVVVGDCEESVVLLMCSCAVMVGSVRPRVSVVTGECGEIPRLRSFLIEGLSI